MDIINFSFSSLALAVLIFFGGSYFWQRKLIYFPDQTKPKLNENHPYPWKEVKTTVKDQLELNHWWILQKAPIILVFHGNAGNIKDRSFKFNFLIEKGYSVFLAGYRGYGGNPGKPSEEKIIEDAEWIVKWIIENTQYSTNQIILFGESLGSCVSIALAEKYPFKGLIFEGAPSSVLDVGRHHYPFIPVRLFLKDTWDSLSRIKNVRSPLLFIHSRKDKIVPFRFGQKLFNEAPDPKQAVWLEHTGHTDNLDEPAVQKAILNFISK